MDLCSLLSGHFINPLCRRTDFKITRIVSSLLLFFFFSFTEARQVKDENLFQFYLQKVERPSNRKTFSILPATKRLRERPPEKINTRNLKGGGVGVERKRDDEKRETDVY